MWLILATLSSRAQEVDAVLDDEKIHEMNIVYWKLDKDHKRKQFKITIGDKLKVKTWDGVKIQGLVMKFKGDSILLGSDWLRVREIQDFVGKAKTKYSGLIQLGVGIPLAYGGYQALDSFNDEYQELNVLTQIVLLPIYVSVVLAITSVLLYGILATGSGVASPFVGKGLNLSGYQKEIHLHTYDEMLMNMSSRELKRHLKKSR